MDDEPNLDDAPPTKTLKISPPIHLLANELLVKIIEKLPRTQWPALELVDHKFRDAVLLAWESAREVDIERDFIYSESKTKSIKGENEYASSNRGRLRLQIVQKTRAILKKLTERSPFITSLSGVALNTDDPTLNTMALQYLSTFEHLETIKFVEKQDSGRIVNGRQFYFLSGIPLINFVEFLESTQSRATLKEIDIDHFRILNDRIMFAIFDRLRAAFANGSNVDPTRQSLQLESFTMRTVESTVPLTFFNTIDTSRMTKLSLGHSHVEPTVLTTLIIGAQRLRHIDFAFLQSCNFYANMCQGGRRQSNKELLAALESHQQLTSLGFNSIWYRTCACHQFETEFKKMLRTIGAQLVNFVFKPAFLPPNNACMGEIRDIIQSEMPNLKSITLDKYCAWDPEELRGIADHKELEEIEFASYDNGNNYEEALMNEVVATILIKSPRLKRFIGVGYCPDQRVAGELCKLNNLIDLRINTHRLAEISFFAFCVFAENLQVLHLGCNGEGVESGLIKLIGKATKLRELVANGSVTDRLLECLAERCPNLEKFEARLANGITFNGLRLLVDRCPNLRVLYVENTTTDTFASSLKNLTSDRYRKLETWF